MTLAHVLVVEDEKIVAKGIQSELERMGYEVPALAATGAEAIAQAEGLHPDLVLMDIVLKGDMDGIEAAQEIRQRFDIPIVYLTAYEDEKTLGRARATEPFGYLLKPYEERELRTTIEMALHKHRRVQQLKQAERWLFAILRSIDDAVLATDTRLGLRFINPIGAALTGWAEEDALGRDLFDVCRLVDERTRLPVADLAGRAIRQSAGVDFPAPVLLRSKDGREWPVEGHLAPIYDAEGSFTGTVAVFRDISGRRELERLRIENEAHVRQAVKMEAVARLAGGIAHDFNNALTAILGNTSLVLSAIGPADPNRPMLADVEGAGLRAARRVEQLRAFSGRSRLTLAPLDLNEAIDEQLPALRSLLAQGCVLDFAPGRDLWKVSADQVQLKEVLDNLCANAADAMPQGGCILIETENVLLDAELLLRHPEAQPGEYVRLRVQDPGQGMAEEVRARMYEPFFTTKEMSQGTGLGLAIVFGIVEQHNGWIECSSAAGQGTVFDIFLPRYGQNFPALPLPAKARRPHAGPPAILLADDEPMVRELGQKILAAQGYRVLLAEDGRHALDLFRQHRDEIDLVILDLAMSRLSGKDAWQEMLRIDPQVRVLFSSGYFAEDLMAEDSRVVGFINKPYHPKELTDMVRGALEKGH